MPVNNLPAPKRNESPAPGHDWAVVLAEHGSWLRCVVLSRVGEPQAVDEVLQEVSLAAVRSTNPPPSAALAPWLYRLAVRQTLLYRRKQGRKRKLIERYTLAYPPGDTSGEGLDPLAWLLTDERRMLVRDCLAQLDPRDAEVLLLKYLEDVSYRELSARIGVSESAIEARLHRARGRLRKHLAARQVIETVG